MRALAAALAVLLTCTALGAGAAPHDLIASSYARSRLYVRPEEMGVKHCTLTGTFRLKQYTARLEPVGDTQHSWPFLAHFFLKAISASAADGSLTWKVGF